MKKIFLSMFAVTCLFSTQKATAQSADDCMASSTCAYSITVNSGHTSKYCDDDAYGCSCAAKSCTNYYLSSTGYCPGTYPVDYGATVTGKECCHSKTACPLEQHNDTPVATDVVETSTSQDSYGLQSTFEPRAYAYYGIVDSTNRSPNYGRTVSIDARLDACMGSTAVDQITASSSDQYAQWQTCTGSNYCGSTLVNGYCSANSNQVCTDRCNCKYQAYLNSIGFPVVCNNY